MKLSFVKKHIEKVDARFTQHDDIFDLHRFIPDTIVEKEKNVLTWITNSYVHKTLGGSEYMAHAINKFLMQYGYRINVIGPWDTTEFEGVNLINIRETSLVKHAIGQCTVLLAQNYTYPSLATQIAGRVQKHVIIFIHTTIIEWDPPPYTYEHYTDSSKIHLVFNTEWVKSYFKSSLDSIILHPPIDTSKIVSRTSRKYVTLITVTAPKGGYQLIEIAKRMPDIQFLGVGNHGIKDTSIPNITYVPNTTNIREIYEQSDIVLVPSTYESWGMVASEAISSGIPVIATPTPGLQDNLASAGIYIHQNSIDEWVSMIRKLKTNPDFYADTVAKCLKRADELNLQNKTDFENLKGFVDEIAQS
jgi:glycosyltransferase involved in cell wall biosynthesis